MNIVLCSGSHLCVFEWSDYAQIPGCGPFSTSSQEWFETRPKISARGACKFLPLHLLKHSLRVTMFWHTVLFSLSPSPFLFLLLFSLCLSPFLFLSLRYLQETENCIPCLQGLSFHRPFIFLGTALFLLIPPRHTYWRTSSVTVAAIYAACIGKVAHKAQRVCSVFILNFLIEQWYLGLVSK